MNVTIQDLIDLGTPLDVPLAAVLSRDVDGVPTVVVTLDLEADVPLTSVTGQPFVVVKYVPVRGTVGYRVVQLDN